MNAEAAWLLALLLEARPPGDTHFSAQPVQACHGAEECAGATWSTFYGTWVRQETADEGRARYWGIAATQERAIAAVMCVRLDGSAIEGCLPEPVALDKKTQRLLFGPLTAVALLNGAAIAESGLREDVQMGRGRAKRCPPGRRSIPGVCGESDDGGQGRGPGGEACFMQIHPSIGGRFADGDPELLGSARAGDRAAQEAVMQSLLGEENLARCWRTGLRALLHAKAYCDWWQAQSQMAKRDPYYAVYSLYGTGTSCISPNHGKTLYRYKLFRSLQVRARVLSRARD